MANSPSPALVTVDRIRRAPILGPGAHGQPMGLTLFGSGPLGQVRAADCLRLVGEHGLLVLRGFDACATGFAALGQDLFQRSFVHHNTGRRLLSEASSLHLLPADGSHRLAHIERGYAPAIPDLIAFYCQAPAKTGGLTTFHDGAEVFALLDSPARGFFESHRMRWRLRIRRPLWHRVFGLRSQDQVRAFCEQHLRQLVDIDAGERVSYDFDGTDLLTDFLTPSVRRRARDGKMVFANGGLAYLQAIQEGNAIPGMLTMENGASFPQSVLEEGMLASQRCAVALALQEGDCALVDNLSLLHGRTAFTDPERKMLVRFGQRFPNQ